MSERLDPYRVAFTDSGLAERHFPLIERAGAERGLDLAGPDRFLMLPETGDLVRELGAEGSIEAFTQLGLLAFHAFRFRRAGEVRLALDEATLRALIGGPPLGRWSLRAPAEAGYFQLPRHLLWTRDAAGAGSPVDGFFWSLPATPRARLELLLVEGLLAGSESFSVFEVSAPPPAEGHWGDLQARATGPDFANLLPGGELRHLHGLDNAGELLKLASRVFHHYETHGPLRDRAGAGGDRQSPGADG